MERLKKYEQQEKILEGRNSYSKTAHDATFMRTKDDHMKNGQLKPCYNVQFSTSNQVLVNYTLGQTTADTSLYIAHLEDYASSYGLKIVLLVPCVDFVTKQRRIEKYTRRQD